MSRDSTTNQSNPETIRILLVADRHADIRVVEAALGPLADMLVRTASSEEALQEVSNTEFAVILLSSGMVLSDALEAAGKIRSHAKAGQTPLLLIVPSGNAGMPFWQKYAEGAVDDTVQPIVKEVLQTKVASLVDRYRKNVKYALTGLTPKKTATGIHEIGDSFVEGRRQFRAIVNQAATGIVQADAHGRMTLVNKKWCDMLGYVEEELLGKNVIDITAPGSVEITKDSFAQFSQGKDNIVIDKQYVRKDGSVLTAASSVTALRGTDGALLGAVAIVIDISERKRTEALVANQKKVLELAVVNTPLLDILEVLVRAAEEHADGTIKASIMLLDADGKHLRHGVAPSLPAAYLESADGVAIGPMAGPCGSAAYLRRSVIVHDTQTDPLCASYKELALEHGLGACWSKPIISASGDVLGVFAFYYQKDRVLTSVEKAAMPMLINTAALVIDRHRQIQARRAAQTELEQAKARLEATLAAGEVATWTWDIKNDRVYGDANLARIFSVPEADIYGNPIDNYIQTIHPEDVTHVSKLITAAVTTGEPYEAMYRIKSDNGQYRSVIARGKTEYDAHNLPLRLPGVVLDITPQKQVEEALRMSQERYRTLFDSMEQGFCVVEMLDDPAGEWNDYRFLEMNPAFVKHSGLDDAVGRTAQEVIPDLEPYWIDLFGRVATTGESIRYENEAKGMHRWFEGYATRLGEPQNKKVAILFSDITERKYNERRIRDFNEQLAKQANYDPLTGLPNRRLFRDRLDQEIRHAESAGHSMALAFIDLDRFKEVNDLLGHDAGDSLLKQAAVRILQCVRMADTVARLGGDEFTVILTEADEIQQAEQVAQRILDALDQPFQIGDQTVRVSGSIGITVYPMDAHSPEDLIRNADQAMYLSKAAGRNQLSFFQESMQVAAINRLKLISELREAVPRQQLELYFQPIVEIVSGAIIKAEALVRWQHPTRGLILPAEFISLAEETGLIHELGNWVFEKAAALSKQWGQRLGKPFQVSINKSPVQFTAHPHEHALDWIAHLAKLGLAKDSISVEITEGLLLNVSDAVSEKLNELQKGGIEVAIDDFGTGYSSLTYLKKLRIDYLKIDQSFVRDMLDDPQTQAIVETIIVMAQKLGLKVIAEGVERHDQCEWLQRHGCTYGQGFLFSEPVPAADFERLLFPA